MNPATAYKCVSAAILSVTAALFVTMTATSAQAQTSDSLERFRKSRTVLIGARENAAPFSTYQANGTTSGYMVDLCNKVVDQLRKDLKISDLKVVYVPVTPSNRLAKLKSGEIDLECGQTVITRARMSEVDFSYATFVSGEKVLVRADSNFGELESLKDRPVAVVKGTTAEKLVARMRDEKLNSVKIVPFDTNVQAFKALQDSQVDGFVQLDISLEALRVRSAKPDALKISKTQMSIEPIAIAVRKNDPALLATVNKVLAGVFSSGEINAIYDKWFATGDIKWPAPRLLRENISRPSSEPGVALSLGQAL